MKFLLAVVLSIGASFGQSDAPKRDLAAERQQVVELLKQAQALTALPLVEDLVAANPDDATVQGWLAYCLYTKARHDATAAETPALLKRAREAAVRAQQLGNTWPLLKDLLAVLNSPAASQPQQYSSNAEANAKMQEGEQAFGKGDYPAALADYSAALRIDPKLYQAAVFGGDVCFRTKDIACSAEWFGRAVAIDPARETAYRYWGDALMAAGKMLEARDKFIEAVIAEPSQRTWAGLSNWAKKNNCNLTAPKIDRPKIGPDPAANIPKPDENDDTGRTAWQSYVTVRSTWHAKHPAATRHTLEEETAALNAVADAVDPLKIPHLDPQLANILALKRDGLLECWIFLSGGPDAGLTPDYAAYRAAHHDEMRAYFDKYLIHPAH